MWLKALILFVSLSANIWLWGHWTFSQPTQMTVFLILNTLLGAFIFIYPIHYLITRNRIRELFLKKRFLVLIYIYIFLNMALSLSSFYGLIQYILPVKILLIALFLYLKWQGGRLLSSKKTDVSPEAPRTQKDNEF